MATVVAEKVVAGEVGWGRRGSLPWRSILIQATSLWVITRLLSLFFTWSWLVFTSAGAGMAGTPVRVFSLLDLQQLWDRWDTQFYYVPLALHGYDPHALNMASFFPLYPMLVHGVYSVTHWPIMTCALIVGNIGTLLGLIALTFWLVAETNRPIASVTLLLYLAYPLAFFLTAAYPMGWLLAGVAGVLFALRQRWWWLAAPCAFVAAATHPLGIFVVIPISVEAISQSRSLFSREVLHSPIPKMILLSLRKRTMILQLVGMASALIAAPFALYLFMRFCQHTYHDQWAFLASEHKEFGYIRVWPWTGLGMIIHNIFVQPAWSYYRVRVLIDILPLLTACGLTLYALVRRVLPWRLTLFCAALCLSWVCSPVVGTLFQDVALGAGRHTLVVLPLFLVAGKLLTPFPRVTMLAVVTGVMMQIILLAFFLSGGWIV